MKTNFTLRGDFRNWLARLLLSLANKIATDNVICDSKQRYQFRREWEAIPYPAAPKLKFCRPDSQ
jgi:hypothetical protein